jgi:dipeptidyl aminopeptidase/acylaminoacyl peptidase
LKRQTASIPFLVLAAAVLAAGPAPGAGRPMTVDDLLTAVRITDPRLSPDGRLVAYVRTTTEMPSGKRAGQVWIASADGSGGARQITFGEKTADMPLFSPDGRTLAFLSARGGSRQVYVLDLAGGEARKLTDFAKGVEGPLVFSPDGKKLALVSDVFPGCADEACNKKMAEEAEKSPVKVHKLTRLLYRHWDSWRENVRHHIFLTDLATGAAVDLTPGDFDSPANNYEDRSVAFSPDGTRIAFVSNRDGNDAEASSTNKDVWLVPAAGGPAVKVTANRAQDAHPAFSPDGKTLAVRSQRRAGFEADRWYLDLHDVATKEKRTLFTTPDLSVTEFVFSPDGKTVLFTAEREGTENLYSVDSAGGTPREIVTGGVIGSLQAGRGFVLFSKTTLTSPADLFRASVDAPMTAPAKVTRLTDANPAFRGDVAFAAPESLWVKGAKGDRVQYWLVKPPSFDPAKKYPAVFLIHGGPQGAWQDGWSFRWCPSLWAAQGWIVALPNPRGSTGFGQSFVDEISQDWGGKVMTDLDAVFDAVVKMPFVDSARTGIAGASYGGYAVDWILGHTDRFKAAVTHDGVFNLQSMSLSTEEQWFSDWDLGGEPWSQRARENYAKWSPHLFADKIRTPTLVITNELDFRVPVDQGLQLFTVLKRKGVPSEALVFPDEGHFVLKPLNSKRWHEEVFAWMRKWL